MTIVEADEEQWQEYDALARRAYGHPVEDILRLGAHADRRVVMRSGKVIAGGMGMLIPQVFGGRAIPGACLGSGCVAPEERGGRLAGRLLTERIRALRERGAVLATLWTNSNGYARKAGWEAPAQVFTWSVAADELRRSFRRHDFDISHGLGAEAERLRRDLAHQWNGPLIGPEWWTSWQREKYGSTSYQFSRRGEAPAGSVSLSARNRERAEVVVQEFWASDDDVASAMLEFLGSYSSSVPAIEFERTSLPPYPVLLHNLHHSESASARAKPGWMFRILDFEAAVRLRGWPNDVEATVPIRIAADGGDSREHYALRIADGKAELSPTRLESRVTFTPRQFAVWYAGGYRTVATARLSGVRGAPEELAPLIRATTDREPWMSDHF
ncbi:enhanced intracellular survival protein Eis [Streptomyces sp. NPDC088726]|uniref:GNAT family N-acetyltransferase n=1 Tax=Streptomyces sp. NPDC088726 TaxID=3365874 RepID=UPI0038170829